MNFKKTWKRFFTLSRRSEGFTLVELIVVIAILAILAGVAVPAYSGYIKKANKAADLQLLGAVNTAFAAACLENNVDVNTLTPATAKMPLTGNEGAMSINLTGVAPYADSFKNYYAGNTGTFKVITQLIFSNGAFHDPASAPSGTVASVTYNGTTLYFSQSAIDALNGSTFMNEEAGLGTDELLEKLDFTTNFAGALLTEDPENQSSALNAVIADPTFQKTFAGYLGIDTTDMNAEQVSAAIGSWATENPNANQNEMMSNALVLYAAQNSTMSTQEATTLLTGNAKQSILDTLNGTADTAANTPAAMAQAALAYGMYTSYAHYTGDQDLIDQAASPNALDVMNMLNDTNFKSYVSSTQGQEDLTGYLNAMEMINTAAGDSSVAGGILENGFTDTDLSGLLGSVLG